jgi:HEAT repeat protein
MAGQCSKAVIEPLFRAFKDTDPEVRAAAMTTLAQVPTRDRQHLAAALVPLLHDANWNVQQSAINTLTQCGDDGNVHWLALLKDKEMPLRAIACNILKQKKQEFRALTPALVAMARDPESRWLAAATLHEIATPQSFGLLFEVLQADKTVGPALRRVDKSGKEPAKMVAALLREMKNVDATVNRGAALTLEQIVLILPPGDTLVVLKKQDVVPALKALVPPLAKKLTAADAAMRRATVDMLGQLRALTTTIEQRVSTSPGEEVIKLYGEIEPLRQEIETALQNARNDSDNQVRRVARQALRASSLGDSFVFPGGIAPPFLRLGGPVP